MTAHGTAVRIHAHPRTQHMWLETSTPPAIALRQWPLGMGTSTQAVRSTQPPDASAKGANNRNYNGSNQLETPGAVCRSEDFNCLGPSTQGKPRFTQDMQAHVSLVKAGSLHTPGCTDCIQMYAHKREMHDGNALLDSRARKYWRSCRGISPGHTQRLHDPSCEKRNGMAT